MSSVIPVNEELSLRRGFSAAIVATVTGLNIVVDVVHRVMREQTVRDMINQVMQEVDDR